MADEHLQILEIFSQYDERKQIHRAPKRQQSEGEQKLADLKDSKRDNNSSPR